MKKTLNVLAAILFVVAAGCASHHYADSNRVYTQDGTIYEPSGAQWSTNAPKAASQPRDINQRPYPGTSPFFDDRFEPK